MDRKELSFKRIIETNGDEYLFAEKLLVDAFPPDEYRSLSHQREFVKRRDNFHMNIICCPAGPVGIISYWKFDTFTYVEHFAILPTLRSNGYGAAAIKKLIEQEKSIVLEVEKPEDETSRRRIAFYRRCGLELCEKEYIQPAYRDDSNEIPMHLMSRSVNIEHNFEEIKSVIYREVYGK